jgi:hypothetical protein
MLRFEKIKKGEAEAAWVYQEILDACMVEFGDRDAVIPLLRRLVSEERMHEKLAEELIRVCKRTHAECGLF